MISPEHIPGVDSSRARLLIAVARSIAPCLDSLEGSARIDAIVIIESVAAELPPAGSGRMKSMSRNGTSITYVDAESAFSDDHRSALRALCGAASTRAGLPRGSFPTAKPFGRVWPEEDYT